jgi:hypothetical protein
MNVTAFVAFILPKPGFALWRWSPTLLHILAFSLLTAILCSYRRIYKYVFGFIHLWGTFETWRSKRLTITWNYLRTLHKIILEFVFVVKDLRNGLVWNLQCTDEKAAQEGKEKPTHTVGISVGLTELKRRLPTCQSRAVSPKEEALN